MIRLCEWVGSLLSVRLMSVMLNVLFMLCWFSLGLLFCEVVVWVVRLGSWNVFCLLLLKWVLIREYRVGFCWSGIIVLL